MVALRNVRRCSGRSSASTSHIAAGQGYFSRPAERAELRLTLTL